MVLFAAVYDKRRPNGERSIGRAVRQLRGEDALNLSEQALRVYLTFLIPAEFAVGPGANADDFLSDMISSRQADRSDAELQACVAGLIAVALGSRDQCCHLCTNLFQPGALHRTFGVGNQYSTEIGAYHYDCGCELNADGEIPPGRPQRPPLSRHTLYFALWSSFAALGVSMVTQPNAQQQLHGNILLAPGQDVRQYVLGVIRATWQHLSLRVTPDSEKQCVLVLRTLEELRERIFQRPQNFRGVFRTLAQVQAYEGELQACFVDTQACMDAHLSGKKLIYRGAYGA
jgi:hypothetical protein